MGDCQAAEVTTAEWDGTAYDRASTPQVEAGTRILRRLHVPDGAIIADAGCGSGRVTELLLDAYPDARVVAIDVSSSMLATAEKRLRRHAARLELVEADISQPWPLRSPVDAVVSTNTFHWIIDHQRLFAVVYEALKPGAQLVAITGGVAHHDGIDIPHRKARRNDRSGTVPLFNGAARRLMERDRRSVHARGV